MLVSWRCSYRGVASLLPLAGNDYKINTVPFLAKPVGHSLVTFPSFFATVPTGHCHPASTFAHRKNIPIWVFLFYRPECGPMEYSPRYGRFRALLRKIRQEAGLSQLALAEKLGKPQSFVSKSEIGERSIDFLETMDFCAACHIPMTRFAERLQQGAPDKRSAAKQNRHGPRKTAKAG
jgi:hypothetical protein